MDNAGYTTLTRQSGLLREMQTVANNIANMSTTGFRRDGVIFAEHVHDLGADEASLSMAKAAVTATSFQQGALTQTNGTFDLAIEGDGFFLIQTPQGQELTRAGHFIPSANGELMTPDGALLLDAGGAPVFVPPGVSALAVAADGTVSADGQPLGQIGLWEPADPNDLTHQDGVRFAAPGGVAPLLTDAAIVQGFLESSNVNPVLEVTRMIEVQRAYELGQGFLDKEDERIRSVLRTMGR